MPDMSDAPKAFRVGLVQLCAGRDVSKNITAASALIREAAAGGAQYVQTPEMTNIMELDRERLLAALRPESDDRAATEFRFLARELGIWLHIGSLALLGEAGKPVNRSLLISPAGAVAARYDKIHMFDVDLGGGEVYQESASYQAGRKAVIAQMPWGQLGMTICYDPALPAAAPRPRQGRRQLHRHPGRLYQADRHGALAYALARARHRMPVLRVCRGPGRAARERPRDVRS